MWWNFWIWKMLYHLKVIVIFQSVCRSALYSNLHWKLTNKYLSNLEFDRNYINGITREILKNPFHFIQFWSKLHCQMATWSLSVIETLLKHVFWVDRIGLVNTRPNRISDHVWKFSTPIWREIWEEINLRGGNFRLF